MPGLMREPLLQFLLGGVLIFFVYTTFGPDARQRIDVDAGDLARFRAVALKQGGREPDATRLSAMAEDWVRQEVLYREALALGLDREDEIIRRRLAQKMEFLAAQDVAEPTEDELRTYFSSHAADYREPARLSFTQVYFEPAHATQVDAALARLRTGVTVAGDRFLLANANVPQPEAVIAGRYGEAFARALDALPAGQWSGPLRSPHGLHLVRVDARLVEGLPSFMEVRDRVRSDLVNHRVVEARNAAYTRLRGRYDISIATPPSTVAAK